jgi:hypothetical protein
MDTPSFGAEDHDEAACHIVIDQRDKQDRARASQIDDGTPRGIARAVAVAVASPN